MADASKVILITGAGKRIGSLLARALHDKGFNLVLHCHRSEKETRTLQAELLAQRPSSVLVVQADLRNIGRIPVLLEEAMEGWGRLDVLINNASQYYPTLFGHVTSEQWEDLFQTNVKAPYFLAQEALPYLAETCGCIINIGDANAGVPSPELGLYRSSKVTLHALTESVALVCNPKVRVHTIALGPTLHPPSEPFNGNAREGEIKNIANVQALQKTVLHLIEDCENLFSFETIHCPLR